MPSSKIFRNRWAALLWAAGILWTAYDVAGAAPPSKAAGANQTAPAKTDETSADITAADVGVLANAMGN
jgi:hypothetical protein